MPASRVIRLSLLLSALIVAGDLALTHRLGLAFGIAFPLVCMAAAIAVRPTDFFAIGVFPPILMFAVMLVVSATDRSALAKPDDGLTQGVITGLTEHAIALLVGYALCLGVLAVRQQVLRRRHATRHLPEAQLNLSGSPAPTLSTSGEPDEKSTTVVGNDPHSPQSSTAST